MASVFCGNGHPMGPGDRFCSVCGAPAAESGAPPPPAEPPTPGAAGAAGGPSAAPWILMGIAAVLIGVAVVFLLTRGDGGTTGPTGPISADTDTTATTSAGSTTTSEATTTTSTAVPTSTTTTTVPTPLGDYSADGTWTVLVYAIGDNNLEEAMLGDLKEMRAVTADDPDITFVALADRSDGYTDGPLGRLGNWTTAKLIDISGPGFTEIADWGEANLGDAATLIDFIDAAAAHAPADHYAMVFWDHGSMTGIGADRSHDDVLEPWEIAAGLEAGLQSSGIGTLDLIGFDACLMSSIEVASVVSPYASYMIASEEYEPLEGWDYDGFRYLGAGGATVEGLGRSLVDTYIGTSSPGDPRVTLSMLDLRRYPEFAIALDAFADTALTNIDASAAAIGRRRDRTVRFGSDPDPLKDWFMVDLGELLTRVGRSDIPSADEARDVVAAMDAMVVANGTGRASRAALGLAVHFPPTADLHYPTWYQAVGDPVWSDFLNGYFEAGRALPPERRAQVVRTSPNTTFSFDEYGIEVNAEITAASANTVIGAVMWSGVPEPDGTVTFYSSDQGLVEGTEAWGFYDLTRLELNDGVDTAVAFQQITYNEDATFFTITVPMAYRAPIDASNGVFDDPFDVTLKATVDLDTDEVSIGLYISEFDTVAPFTADPNGLLFPKLPVRYADGSVEWVNTIDVGLWADLDGLGFDFVDLPSGTPLYSELRVSDFGGYSDVFIVETAVP